jgi:Tfp pilus assembly protein PilX
MTKKKSIKKNEKGMVLVLAIFMLALLSMIGLAAMMTSTTETEITANEKFHKLAFYQTESGLTIGTELIELMGGYDYVEDNYYYDDNNTIKVIDGSFLFEPKDVPESTGIWNKDNQTDMVQIKSRSSSPNTDFPFINQDSSPDIQLLSPFNAVVDVDKVAVKLLAGGGAEFGSGALGIGVSTHRVIYNIDSIGGLTGGRAISTDHIMGFQFIPRF